MLKENEEYRALHTKMVLRLTWKDMWAIIRGKRPIMSFCCGIKIYKKPDGSLDSLDLDTYSTKVVVSNLGEVEDTKEAIFDYDKLHK